MTSREQTHLTRGASDAPSDELSFTPTWTNKDQLPGFRRSPVS